MTQQRTIALAAGGSGGHFFPAEALARELTSRGHRVVIFTDSRGEKYAERLGDIQLITLPATAIGAGIRGKLHTLRTIVTSAVAARKHIKQLDVRIMIAFGGYPCFAPAIGAKLAGIPLVLHEQGAKMSLANQWLLKLCTRLATSFPSVKGSEKLPPENIVETGNPVRSEITALRLQPYSAPTADGPLHLLVTGGSQSANIFGEIVPPALLSLPEPLRSRIHLSLQYKGEEGDEIAAKLQTVGIQATIAPFFRDMAERLARTHLVIARAGATTAAELLVVGRPAIFVPIPQGGSKEEQLRNAQTMEAAGAGWCIPQQDFSIASLSALLADLLTKPAQLIAAAAAAHRLGAPQAAQKLADLVENTI